MAILPNLMWIDSDTESLIHLQVGLSRMQQGRDSQASRFDFDMEQFLRSVSLACASNPKLALGFAILMSVLSLAAAGMWLEFKIDRADLIDPSADFHRRWLSYVDSFGDSSDMVVVVEADQPERIKAAVEEVGVRLKAEPKLFDQVLFKIDPGPLRQKGLQYLSPDQLEKGLQQLQSFQPILNNGWALLRLGNLSQGLMDQLGDGMRLMKDDPANPIGQQQFGGSLLQLNLLSKSLERFVTTKEFTNPWPEMLQVDAEFRQSAEGPVYLLNDAGTMGFLKAKPLEKDQGFTGANPSIEKAREIVAEVRAKFPGVEIGLTGIPVLESDEMRDTQADMTIASVLSFFGCWLLLIIGFRGYKHPFLAMLMLLVGTCWSFGFTTAVVGHLNILSVSFAAILFGLGIDYAIVFLAHYLEGRHHGLSLLESVGDSASNVGLGIVTVAVTTSLAFFCACFTDFLGVAELGIIGGGGVLLCLIANFIVLPALIALADRNTDEAKLPNQFEGTVWRLFVSRNPRMVALVSTAVVVAIGACAFSYRDGHISFKVKYDYNLLNLQADGLESVEVQKRIFREAEKHNGPGQGSLLFAVSLADSAEHARELKKKYMALPTVHHVEELGSRLPATSPEKLKLLVQAYQSLLARLPEKPPPTAPVNPDLVGKTLEELHKTLLAVDNPLAKEAAVAFDHVLDVLDQLELSQQSELLTGYQFGMVSALLGQLNMLNSAANPEPITLDDFPKELSSRFVSKDGKWLVQIYPKNSIWDIEPLQEFVKDVRSVDPEATGTPLQNYEASQQFVGSFLKAAVYAFLAVAMVLIMDFLGHRLAIQALIPTLIIVACIGVAQNWMQGAVDWKVLVISFGALWIPLVAILDWKCLLMTMLAMGPPILGAVMMYGLMALLHVDLNPANLIVLPLILGIGVDVGVHVVHDFRHHHGRYEMSGSTFNGTVLTTTTSIVGFGSMMVSAHRGLYSLGFVLSIGLAGTLYIALVVLPAILTIVRGRMPDVEPTAAIVEA